MNRAFDFPDAAEYWHEQAPPLRSRLWTESETARYLKMGVEDLQANRYGLGIYRKGAPGLRLPTIPWVMRDGAVLYDPNDVIAFWREHGPAKSPGPSPT